VETETESLHSPKACRTTCLAQKKSVNSVTNPIGWPVLITSLMAKRLEHLFVKELPHSQHADFHVSLNRCINSINIHSNSNVLHRIFTLNIHL